MEFCISYFVLHVLCFLTTFYNLHDKINQEMDNLSGDEEQWVSCG